MMRELTKDTDVARIRVVTRDNGAGLSRDLGIVAGALSRSHAVTAVGFGGHRVLNRLRERWARVACRLRGLHDVQISLERVYPSAFGCAARHVLIPNPEWFSQRWIPLLPRFDLVLCKSRQAEALFTALGCNARYIGFTCEDRWDQNVPRDRAFFHLAGRSTAKGTATLLDTWARHPEWPTLTVVQRARHARRDMARHNVVVHAGHLPDIELKRLQNAHRFHICPSEVEGFGHSIAEAMSVGAVVLTTDTAPMNELVDAQCGLLLSCTPGPAMGVTRRHHVQPATIEAGVEHALRLPESACLALGRSARNRFLARDAGFRERLVAALEPARIATPVGELPEPHAMPVCPILGQSS